MLSLEATTPTAFSHFHSYRRTCCPVTAATTEQGTKSRILAQMKVQAIQIVRYLQQNLHTGKLGTGIIPHIPTTGEVQPENAIEVLSQFLVAKGAIMIHAHQFKRFGGYVNQT